MNPPVIWLTSCFILRAVINEVRKSPPDSTLFPSNNTMIFSTRLAEVIQHKPWCCLCYHLKKNEYLSIVFDNKILLFPGETVLLPLQLFFLFAYHHREPQLVHHHQAAATSHSGDEVRVHQEPIEQRENYWDSYSCRHARSRNNLQDRALTVGSPRTGTWSNIYRNRNCRTLFNGACNGTVVYTHLRKMLRLVKAASGTNYIPETLARAWMFKPKWGKEELQ